MQYLITRRAGTSREELVAHWFANHMPLVIAANMRAAEKGRASAQRYMATLFGAERTGAHAYDGVAQLWWDEPVPRPDPPHGTVPTDTFQQKVEPYVPWPTVEYAVLDGGEHLAVEPNDLNAPFPCTRSGFEKVTFLVGAQDGVDSGALFDHWLDAHVPNVADAMRKVGGFRYVVSHSMEPDVDPFVGMAELYFPDTGTWRDFVQTVGPDGFERFTDASKTVVFHSDTEMIGIP